MGATQAGSQPVSYARATGQIILCPRIIGVRVGGGDVGREREGGERERERERERNVGVAKSQVERELALRGDIY